MRPLSLSIEGLTAFADPTVVDFRALQLFAITGTTGAGKSTLIDAILLALFGRIPRTGLQHGQLIAHGKEQINVLLEFEARGERYRVARTIRRSGASKVHLEHVTAAGNVPLAGKTRDVEAEVERILGIDYDAFTRCVVLPQGQFDEFLRGDPKDRRRILVNLLGLSRYERMARLCGERQRELQVAVDTHTERLRSEFATATPQHLDTLLAEQAAAEAADRQLAAHAAQLAELVRLAQTADAARKHTATQQAARGALLRQQAEIAAERQRLDADAATFDTERRRLEAEVAAAAHDPTRPVILARAEALLLALARAVADRPQLARDAATAAARRQQCEQELAAATAQEPTLRLAHAAQQDELAAAEAELEARRRDHAAAHLRATLQPGGECPVCAQSVAALPPPLPTDLAAHQERVATARQLLQGAATRWRDAERTVAQRRDDLPALLQQDRSAAGRLARADDDLQKAGDELRAAGLSPPQPPTADALAALQRTLATERDGLQQLAARRAAATTALEALLQRHRDAAAARDRSVGRAEAVAAQLLELDAELTRAAAASSAAAAVFATAAAAAGVDAHAADTAARLQQLQRDVTQTIQQSGRRLGELQTRRDHLEAAIAQADRLRAALLAASERAALAKALALLLRGDRFQDWVLATAVTRLCQDGSTRLRALSNGRYSLRHDGSDFAVVDHWNADRERSVRTLSGGETFLASLALALALADGIRSFAARDGDGSTLDCLFVDEGFGALDGDALEAAVQALETLHGGHRMVGVVTHLQALAERLPARLHVENHAGRARVVAS